MTGQGSEWWKGTKTGCFPAWFGSSPLILLQAAVWEPGQAGNSPPTCTWYVCCHTGFEAKFNVLDAG